MQRHVADHLALDLGDPGNIASGDAMKSRSGPDR